MRRQRKTATKALALTPTLRFCFNDNLLVFVLNDNRDNRDNALNEAAKKTATKALALTPTLRFCFNANLFGFCFNDNRDNRDNALNEAAKKKPLPKNCLYCLYCRLKQPNWFL